MKEKCPKVKLKESTKIFHIRIPIIIIPSTLVKDMLS